MISEDDLADVCERQLDIEAARTPPADALADSAPAPAPDRLAAE